MPGMTGIKRTPATDNLQAKKQMLQVAIDQAGARLAQVHQIDMTDQRSRALTSLVRIRAMKTHHPAPTIGAFSFGDVYTNFREGLKYVVPMYVALALEENDNAMTIQ